MRVFAARNSKVTIGDRLAALRAEFPACELAVFVDLAACNVLAASASPSTRQETLEAFCDRAVEALNGAQARSIQHRIGYQGAGFPDRVLVMTTPAQWVFLRSPVARDEALCLQYLPDGSAEALQDAAENLLRLIAEEVGP